MTDRASLLSAISFLSFLAVSAIASACTPDVTLVDEYEEELETPSRAERRDDAPPATVKKVTTEAGAPKADPVPPNTSDASTGNGSGPCVTDSDCTTWSSYCAEAPCRCIPQRRDVTSTCEGKTVSCFRDPCVKETAVCVAGACVL
jgi:hypothetical protein